MKGCVHLESWAGRTTVPVEIIGHTKKRTRVKVLADEPLKGWKAGDVVLVPAYAVTAK